MFMTVRLLAPVENATKTQQTYQRGVGLITPKKTHLPVVNRIIFLFMPDTPAPTLRRRNKKRQPYFYG